MIDTLNFIEDLKEIRKSMPYTNISSELVDSKIKKKTRIRFRCLNMWDKFW